MGDADRSTIEIKLLLKNLDPSKSSSIKHKDRLRRLNKFRNYVTTNPPPEFYDDDYSLLLLGSESPTACDDDDDQYGGSKTTNLVGLLRAAGCPSTDHKDALKRSARPTIALLRYLCLEFGSTTSTATSSKKTTTDAMLSNLLLHGELNGFAAAFCALNVPQLRTIRFDVHIGKGGGGGKDGGIGGNDMLVQLSNTQQSRGGSKEDACHLLALLLVRHTDTDYETLKPLNIMDFLPDAMSRYEFEVWLGENVSSEVRSVIQENILAATTGQVGGMVGRKTEEDIGRRATMATSSSAAARGNPFDDADDDEDGVLGVFGRNSHHPNKGVGQESQANMGRATGGLGGGFNPFGGDMLSGSFTHDGKPTRWSATHMASEKERTSGALFLEEEQKKAIAERKKAEEEKKRLLGRDPLGIHNTEQFDLQDIENNRESLILQALAEVEAEIDYELSSASESGVETVNWLEAQRQSLLNFVEAKKKSIASIGTDGESKEAHSFPSVLPTSPDFDPILFLTLVHRNATYKDLQESTSRLSRKTDNQVERLQNLVRDNFALFIKCSEGIDIFADQNSDEGNNQGMQQLQNRFKTLDHLAQSASDQARNSFKPLLDNTDEVRKVQSALSVLQRVAPLLQVPSLMRQHIENGNFSSVVKAYRKVLVIDKHECDVDLLRFVRLKAGEAAQDARHDLELILADETSPANSLLDAIRDLGELLELLEEEGENDKGDEKNRGEATPRSSGQNASRVGTFTIDRHVICVRDHTPALACLLLQTTHFRSLVDKSVANAEATVERLFGGDNIEHASSLSGGSGISSSGNSSDGTPLRGRDKWWKFEVLEARVDATLRVVTLAKYWLPRLLQIGRATQESEKRRMARQRGSKKFDGGGVGTKIMSAGDVFKSIVDPALTRLVEHAAYCALGCANQGSKYKISATFGKDSAESLCAILNSPLPATQTAKCAADLAELAEAINESSEAMFPIRLTADDGDGMRASSQSPLERCSQLTNAAVIMIEQRVCIYSFDACARKCSISASGNGVFDGDALLHCVQKLSDDLTRSDECFREIEKGCLLVCQKCCEGLMSYVKDRSDAARLRVVAECADALNKTNIDVVREVSYLTNGEMENLESNLSSVISSLEKEMFGAFLDNVKRNAKSCARLGLIEVPSDYSQKTNKADELGPFPPYLASSFLAIVRCRAQVERALRDLSRSDGVTYQFLALQTASDGVVESICMELKSKWNQVRPGNLHVYSIHLQFLISTLKKYLSDDILSLASDTRRMLSTSGMGNGPEGLTALENLERLGRVYVMCLGD